MVVLLSGCNNSISEKYIQAINSHDIEELNKVCSSNFYVIDMDGIKREPIEKWVQFNSIMNLTYSIDSIIETKNKIDLFVQESNIFTQTCFSPVTAQIKISLEITDDYKINSAQYTDYPYEDLSSQNKEIAAHSKWISKNYPNTLYSLDSIMSFGFEDMDNLNMYAKLSIVHLEEFCETINK